MAETISVLFSSCIITVAAAETQQNVQCLKHNRSESTAHVIVPSAGALSGRLPPQWDPGPSHQVAPPFLVASGGGAGDGGRPHFSRALFRKGTHHFHSYPFTNSATWPCLPAKEAESTVEPCVQ